MSSHHSKNISAELVMNYLSILDMQVKLQMILLSQLVTKHAPKELLQKKETKDEHLYYWDKRCLSLSYKTGRNPKNLNLDSSILGCLSGAIPHHPHRS
jgi:hypothetical protein